jgi:hypothetical protein
MKETTGNGDWDCDQCYKPVIGHMLFLEPDDFSGDVLVLHPGCKAAFFEEQK